MTKEDLMVKIKNILILTFIPVTTFVLSHFLLSIKGPYYVGGNFDPEYAYLLNSLNVLQLIPPAHFDHPGIPVHLLSALVIFGKWASMHLSGSALPLVDSVLRDPEAYLHTINTVFNVMISFALFSVAVQILRFCGRLLPAITLQLTYLLFLEMLLILTRVSPEPILVLSTLILIYCIMPEIYRDEATRLTNKSPVFAGMALGLGVATKVTFLPLFGFVLLFQGLKRKGIAIFSSFWTILFFMIPIQKHFPQMYDWFISLLTHKGQYGHGEKGFPGAVVLWANLKGLYSAEPLFFILLGYFIAVIAYLRYKKECFPTAQLQKLLSIGSVVIMGQIIITVKHPAARYMVPSIMVTTLLNAAAVEYYTNKDVTMCKIDNVLFGLFCLIVFSGFVFNCNRIIDWTRNTANDFRANLTIRNECHDISYYGSSRIEYALAFGDDFSGRVYGNRLKNMYPDALFFNLFTKKFHAFDRFVADEEILGMLNSGECLLLVGFPLEAPSAVNLRLTLEPGRAIGNQVAYRLIGFKSQ